MKFLVVSVIVIGLIIILNAGGIETPSGGFVKTLLDSGLASFKDSETWTLLRGILVLGTAGAVIAGLFTRSSPDSYLKAALVWFLGGVILTDMITVYLKLIEFGDTWVIWVASSIFIPLTLIFVVSLVSFWGGSDG